MAGSFNVYAKLPFLPWAIIVILWIIHDLRREGDHWSINMELTCTLQLLFWSLYMANFIGTSIFKSFSNSNKCSFQGQPLSWSSMISPLGSTLQRNFKSLIFFYFSVLWQFHLFLPIRGTLGQGIHFWIFHSQDLISYSLYCVPHNSYDVS